MSDRGRLGLLFVSGRFGLLEQVSKHVDYAIGQERGRPAEYVESMRQLIGSWGLIELLQLYLPSIELEEGGLVVIRPAVVGC